MSDDQHSTIQRLTLDCGHLRLSGPWDSPLEDDGRARHMIGDITWCEPCPRVPAFTGTGRELQLRQVLNVEDVPAGLYREADDKVHRAWREQIAAG